MRTIEHRNNGSRNGRLPQNRTDYVASAFLTNISHELRTSLHAVVGFSEMMRCETHGPLGNSIYQQYAADIHSSGKHMLQIVDSMIDLARIEAGTLVLKQEKVDFRSLTADVLPMVADQAAAKGIALNADIPANCPNVVGDYRALKQILLNLLTNAVKFTSEGEVTIAVSVEQTHTSVVVRDTGIGMSKRDLDSIGRTFRQADASRMRRYNGVGIGLSLALQLAELHGGRLLIESQKGVGTTVAVRIPTMRCDPVTEGSSEA